jgi:hypothetical protein
MASPENTEQKIRFGPAVSLSYDGSDPSHLEIALPCLAEHGLKGTFYLPETGIFDNPKAWQAAQKEGHEIGSHSLFEAADPYGNLPKWTLDNVEADLEDARKLMSELLPNQRDFSFAYPGPDPLAISSVHEPFPVSYRSVVNRFFRVARSSLEGLAEPSRSDVQYLESIDARDLSQDDLIVGAEAAMFSGRWAIFAFQGIGSGEGAIDMESHRALCAWLAEHQDHIKTGPVFELAIELQEQRAAGLHRF